MRFFFGGASCVGHPRDENICLEVAKSMFAFGRRPMVAKQISRAERYDANVVTSRPLERAILMRSSSVEESGRHGHACDSSEGDGEESSVDGVDLWSTLGRLPSATADRAGRAEPSCNVFEVPTGYAAKLEDGKVKGLPSFYADPKQEKKSQADLVKAVGLQEWVHSSEGLEWKAAKRRRYSQVWFCLRVVYSTPAGGVLCESSE
jgi:hypothetical protein